MFELNPEEKIIVGIRKHWFVFFLEVFGLFIAAAVPIIIAVFTDNMFPKLVASVGQTTFENLALFAIAAWLIVLSIAFFVIFTTYYLDMLVVTNQRLIDIDQISLFARDIATAPLQNIEDIKVESLGIFATIFKFGNLHIQTAAESKEILIRGIRHPERARDIVMAAYHEATVNKAPRH